LEALVAKASYLIAMRRLDEAVETIVRAQEIDPLSAMVTSFEVLALVYSGQCDQAIDKAQAALDLEPNYAELYYGLGIAYQEKGRLDEAAGAFEEGCRVVPNSPLMMGFLGGCYGMLGEVRKARSLLERLREQSKRAYVAPVSLALIHIGLGDLDEAFDWLQKACETRDALLSYLKVIPNFKILRSDSRYVSLCERIHLGAPTGV
jgi:serine/threonine-protein kinase